MSFSEPLWLVVGAGVAVVVLLGLRSHARRRRRLAAFLGGPDAARRLTGSALHREPAGRMLLLGLAAVGLGAAAAGPEWEAAPPPRPPEPVVVLALDVSGSMQATDVEPTRLGAAVEIAGELLGRLEGARVGLVLFAGEAYVLAPPTGEHHVLRHLLGGVTPDLVSMEDPGTRLSEGLRGAGELLAGEGADGGRLRSVVLIGDGEAGEDPGAADAAARELAGEGIRIHAVGVGTEAGSEVVLPVGYRRGGRLTDADGTLVVSRLREGALRRLVRSGQGRYAAADDAGALRALGAALGRPGDRPPDAGTEASSGSPFDPALGLAAVALVLLLGESLLDVRWPGRGHVSRGGEGRPGRVPT